jgi:hypothetical protein
MFGKRRKLGRGDFIVVVMGGDYSQLKWSLQAHDRLLVTYHRISSGLTSPTLSMLA